MRQDSFHARYLELVDHIERSFPVAAWRCGDVDLWPLARMDLHLHMMSMAWPGSVPASVAPAWRRVPASLTLPLTNLWKSRHDLAHWVATPRPAHAVLLGDGVSLDWDGSGWRDRFGEPVIAAFEQRGLVIFTMQGGALRRLPWSRPTFAANQLVLRGALAARFDRTRAELPSHVDVLALLQAHDVRPPALERAALERRGRLVGATASAFERVLRVSRPRLAFVTAWYAGLGPAFVLACRRQGVLSIDLQHCPQGGAHKAYGWVCPPAEGYRTLPAVFWCWNKDDAAFIRGWTDDLQAPWHQSLHGGHTQLAPFLNDDEEAQAWDRAVEVAAPGRAEREILVALQPLPGHEAVWSALAAQIRASPTTWRWWIRRHPAATADQDAVFGPLLSLAGPQVVIEPASQLPLPALLRRVSVMVSLASGAASEAAAFGVPSLFLSPEAEAMFPDLIASDLARVVEVDAVATSVAALPVSPRRPTSFVPPPVEETLARLETMAADYAWLCGKA